MKKILISSIAAFSILTTSACAESLEDRIDEIEDRLESVETSTLTDKINMGFTFRTRNDKLNHEKAGVEDESVWTTKLNLNLKSKVSDDVKFSGRITSYKNWGNNYDNQHSAYDSKQGRIANSSDVYMERAYVDWIALKGKLPVIITIGRQPSSDGPSWQFAENSVRKGTYDALLFDGAADGIVATMPLNKIIDNESLAFRLAYGKGVESESYSSSNKTDTIEDNEVVGAFLEGNCLLFPQGKFLLSYAKASDIVADSNTNANGGSKNLGDISWYGLALEIPQIVKNLDFFIHFAKSKAESNGQTVNVNMGNGASEYSLIDGSSNALWTGLRYSSSYGKFGLEYNKAGKNWFSMTSGSLDPYNKLATRGNVIDFYFLKNVSKATHIKVGYAKFNYDYTGSGWQIGTPMDVEAVAQNKSSKNTYAEFVVNF